jgi:hypothetical protein
MDRSSIWHARIPARLRGGGVLAAGVTLTVLATGGVAVASDAAGGGTVTAGTIRACFQPGTPTAPLQVLTRTHASCPTGERRLTWNTVGPQGPQGIPGDPGPQGPPGLSTGVTTGTLTHQAIDAGNTPVTVITAPAVPVSGIYYITASATVQVAGGDAVACAAIPNQIEPQTTQFGPASETVPASLALNGALLLSAGQAPSVICIDLTSNQNTTFLQGSLNATLISSSSGPAAAARARTGRFPLKIVK